MEDDLSRVLNALPGLVWTVLPDGQTDFLNQRWCEYTGLSLEEASSRGWQTAVHPEDLPALLGRWRSIMASGESGKMEARLRRSDGDYRRFHISASPLRDAAGEIVKWYGVSTDIEDRRRAEEALRARELDFRLIVDSIPVPVAVTTPLGEVEALNQLTLEYFGKTFEELKGWKTSDVVHNDDLQHTIAAQQNAHETACAYNVESRHRRADGSYRWFNVRGFPLRDTEGHILRWFHLLIDIDDRKRAEALLAGEKQLLVMVARGDSRSDILEALCRLVESTADGCYCSVVLVDPSGTRLEHGAAPSLPTGFITSIIGRPVNAESGPCAMAAYLNEQVIAADLTTETRWGPYEWCPMAMAYGLRSCWSTPVSSSGGKVLGAFALYYDEPRRPAPFHQNLIEQFTHIASIAIERQRSQEALRNALDEIQKSEAKLRQVIDAIPALAWCNLPDGPNEFLNKGWHEYTGLSPEESHGWGWQAAFHPEDLPPLMRRWMKMLTSGEPDEIEARLRRHDGVYRWFLIRAEPFRDESGGIVRWYGTSTDIDDRKRAEALLSGEKRLLEMVASGRSLPRVLDALCRFVEDVAGPCYCTVYLIDPSGTKFHNAAAPSLPASFNDPIEGAPVACETGPCGMAACLKTQVIASDVASDTRWPASQFRPLALAHGLRSCWSTPVLSLAGDVLGTFAIYQDEPASPTPLQQELIARSTHIASIAIERVKGETALMRSEALLAEAQQLSSTGSFSWRVATDEITWSDELYRIYELETGVPVTLELIRRRVHPDDLTLYERMVEQARQGADDFEWQYRLLMPDRSIKYLHAVARATRDQDGQLEYIAAVQDVTERRLSEEALGRLRSELAHVSRVATLGALTASIAHEVNQPLSGIITNSSTCLRMLAADPPNVEGARETTRRTLRDGNRASEVITRLRALFSKRDASTESVDLNEATREVIALSLSELQSGRIILRTELSEDLPPVTGDRVQLQQVILNLVRNASDAMNTVSDRPRELLIRTERDDAGRVRLSVKDAGVGFEPQAAEGLFRAFYTTKEDGMGIGLSVSRSIIESHHGQLWATPNDGPGATFSFSIPCGPMV